MISCALASEQIVVPVSRTVHAKFSSHFAWRWWREIETHFSTTCFASILHTRRELFWVSRGVFPDMLVDIATRSTHLLFQSKMMITCRTIFLHCLTTRLINYFIDMRRWQWGALRATPPETSLTVYCRRLVMNIASRGADQQFIRYARDTPTM